jgi:hypothetical protein
MKRPLLRIVSIAVVLAFAGFVGAGEPVKEPTPGKTPAAEPAKEVMPVKEAAPSKPQSPAERAVRLCL